MKNVFETRDIYLASFLSLNQIRLIGRTEKAGIVYFKFDSSPTTEKLIMDYHSGKKLVEPIRYVETIRRLRRFVQDTLNEG